MTPLEKLKTDHAALVKRQEETRAKERAAQAKIRTEEQRLARLRQGQLGAIADRPVWPGRHQSGDVGSGVWISGHGWHHGDGSASVGCAPDASTREGRVMTSAPFGKQLRRRLVWGLLRGLCRCLVTLGYLISVLSLLAWWLGAPGSLGLGVVSLALAVGLQCVWGWGLFRE